MVSVAESHCPWETPEADPEASLAFHVVSCSICPMESEHLGSRLNSANDGCIPRAGAATCLIPRMFHNTKRLFRIDINVFWRRGDKVSAHHRNGIYLVVVPKTRNAGGPSSVPGQRTRSHMSHLRDGMLQQKIPLVATKILCVTTMTQHSK